MVSIIQNITCEVKKMAIHKRFKNNTAGRIKANSLLRKYKRRGYRKSNTFTKNGYIYVRAIS